MKDFGMDKELILKFVEHENFIIFIFTVLLIPGLKVFFKRPDFKSDIAEVRSIWDKKDEFDKYPNFIKDGVIKQISVLRFLDYSTFKILCNKDLSYFDIMSINQSLNYNSSYKFEVTHVDNKVEFSLCDKRWFYKHTFEKPQMLTWFFLGLAAILLIILFFLLMLDIKFLNIIFIIIIFLFEIFYINLKFNLDDAIQAKKILDSKKLFKNLQKTNLQNHTI